VNSICTSIIPHLDANRFVVGLGSGYAVRLGVVFSYKWEAQVGLTCVLIHIAKNTVHMMAKGIR